MKILYVTTVGSTMDFFKPFVKELIDGGNLVNIATNEKERAVSNCFKEWGCNVYQLSCSRSPLKKGNLKAIKEIKRIVYQGGYDIVHCHTPIAAACTRFACKSLRKKGAKVIYTAHGFHFYNGAPKKNWMFYYPIEKLCARWTDVLITINKEDYELAKRKLHAKQVEYVPGVGIDVDKFAKAEVDKLQKRREIDIPEDAFMLLSVGELNDNKNHQVVIKALADIGDSNMHYAIAGKGEKKEDLDKLAKKLNVNLHLLGYRSDVAELYKIADLYVLPSIREGLNVSVMEAMASGCPTIVSRIRGNTDMVPSENCFDCNDIDQLEILIKRNDIKNGGFVEMIDYRIINQRIKEVYFGL